MGYVFISYSSHNKRKADKLRNLFNNNNINCKMAPYDIGSGNIWVSELTKIIRDCSCVVLVLTDYAQNSVVVKKEICLASTQYRKAIIAVQSKKLLLNDEFNFYLTNCHIETVKRIDKNDGGIKKVLESVRCFTVIKGENDNDKYEGQKDDKSVNIESDSQEMIVDENGYKYIGQIVNGKKHGKGSIYGPIDLKIYEGDWLNNQKHGKGTMYYSNGDKYVGLWKNNQMNGCGIYYYANGKTEERFYQDNFLIKVNGIKSEDYLNINYKESKNLVQQASTSSPFLFIFLILCLLVCVFFILVCRR